MQEKRTNWQTMRGWVLCENFNKRHKKSRAKIKLSNYSIKVSMNLCVQKIPNHIVLMQLLHFSHTFKWVFLWSLIRFNIVYYRKNLINPLLLKHKKLLKIEGEGDCTYECIFLFLRCIMFRYRCQSNTSWVRHLMDVLGGWNICD